MELSQICHRYRELYIGTVCDALYEMGLPELVLPSYLRPLFPDQRIVGIAYTVIGAPIEPTIGWNEGVQRISSYLEVFEELMPDMVLVSKNLASAVGHFGELTANAAMNRGCVGTILDGNLRDVEGLREIAFPVFYRDLSPLNAIGRWEMVQKQTDVIIGNVTISPGDLVFGEFEGIVIVPQDQISSVLVKAEEIVAAEGKVRQEVRQGATPMESFDRHGHI